MGSEGPASRHHVIQVANTVSSCSMTISSIDQGDQHRYPEQVTCKLNIHSLKVGSPLIRSMSHLMVRSSMAWSTGYTFFMSRNCISPYAVNASCPGVWPNHSKPYSQAQPMGISCQR